MPFSLFRWLLLPALSLVSLHAAGAPAAGLEDLLSPPLLNTWVAPVYPPKALADKLPGRIRVRFIVNEQGAVTKARVIESSDEAFDEAAVQSVLQWHFEPALEGGKAVAKSMDLTVPFDPADAKRKTDPKAPPPWTARMDFSASTKAAQKTNQSAVYPPSLLPQLLRGEVQVAFTVDPEGQVRAPRVLLATHADFVQPALAAMAQWTFRPATQGDLRIASPFATAVLFDLDFPPKSDRLAACGVTLTETGDVIDGLSRKPEPVIMSEPVYPYDLLLAGTTGEAEVEITIAPSGRTEAVSVHKSSDPAFGSALAMAVQGWQFRPALHDGSGVAVKAVVRHAFAIPSAPVARLAERLRTNNPEGLAASGLDAPLRPVYRTPPVYPAELKGQALVGQATIEFIIDREGRGRIAHVVSASREEFGVAAATAVEQWVFDPPMRGGQPVDVRVQIPISFSPPKVAAP